MKLCTWVYCLVGITIISLTGCRIQIKPLQSTLDRIEAQKKESKTNPDVVYRFFDEKFYANGFEWHYPDDSKVLIGEDGSGKNGDVAIRMDLIPTDYSGGAIELWKVTYNVAPYYSGGALQFWIKGSVGGEMAYVGVADDQESDGMLTAVRVSIDKYGGISNDWTFISIPLADFGKRGHWWDEKKQVEVPNRMDWDKICVFQITIEKGDNKKFTVWVDDIYIVKDVFEPAPDVDEEYWDERKETLPLPPIAQRPDVKVLHSLFKDEISGGLFGSVYGGNTAYKTQPTKDKEKNPAVLAMYMDNTDYSGVNINFGKKIDLSGAHKTKAGLAFWAKFGKDVQLAFIGLLDDESDKKKVQTNIVLGDYAKLDTNWQYFMIPLKDFSSQGNWWDEDKKVEVPGEVEWDKIVEICFSSDKYGNRLEDGVPVAIYVDDITIIEEVSGYVDPDEYWNAFKSNEADRVIFDFEKQEDHMWMPVAGEESEIFFTIKDQEDRDLRAKYGKKIFAIEYSNNDWGYVGFSFAKNSSPAELRDWTKHWALHFSFYTDREEETIRIQINDSGKEAFVTNVSSKKGWNEVLVPLKDFKKYPYYQEADAELNNKLDLDAVTQMSFWPATAGMMGKFKIDNVKLTNLRK